MFNLSKVSLLNHLSTLLVKTKKLGNVVNAVVGDVYNCENIFSNFLNVFNQNLDYIDDFKLFIHDKPPVDYEDKYNNLLNDYSDLKIDYKTYKNMFKLCLDKPNRVLIDEYMAKLKLSNDKYNLYLKRTFVKKIDKLTREKQRLIYNNNVMKCKVEGLQNNVISLKELIHSFSNIINKDIDILKEEKKNLQIDNSYMNFIIQKSKEQEEENKSLKKTIADLNKVIKDLTLDKEIICKENDKNKRDKKK